MRFMVSIFLALALFAGAAHADDTADREALRQIKTAYQDAMMSGDFSSLSPFAHDSLTVVSFTGEELAGIDGMHAYWKKMWDMIGQGGQYNIEVSYVPSLLVDSVAVAHGAYYSRVTTSEGRSYSYDGLWTAVLLKTADSNWKLYRVHSGMDPITNSFVSTWLRDAKMYFGLGGLAGGLIAGSIIGYIFSRRRSMP